MKKRTNEQANDKIKEMHTKLILKIIKIIAEIETINTISSVT